MLGGLGRHAGSSFSVYARVQCRKQITGQQKVQFYIAKTKYIADLGIVYLWPKTGQQKVQFYCKDEIHGRSGYNLSMSYTQGELFIKL